MQIYLDPYNYIKCSVCESPVFHDLHNILRITLRSFFSELNTSSGLQTKRERKKIDCHADPEIII